MKTLTKPTERLVRKVVPNDVLFALVYNDGVDTVINLVNEPSVALFRIQEHIRKTAPQVDDDRVPF